VSIAAALVLQPGSAVGANFGSAGTPGNGGPSLNGVWLLYSSHWDIAKRDLTQKYSNGVTATLNVDYIPTDLVVSWLDAPSCTMTYELCVYDSNYGDNGVNGWNSCVAGFSGSHPNQKCEQQWVRINQFFDPPAQRIACHEMGHSVGLRHTGDQASCLKQTILGGNSERLTAHDKGHLNDNY